MACDLAHILPTPIGDGASAELPGLSLPDHATDAAFPETCGFTRQLPGDCVACPRAIEEHLVFDKPLWGPNYQSKAFMLYWINRRNASGEFLRRLFSLIDLSYKMIHGVWVSNSVLINGRPPSEELTGYEFVSASGSVFTLKRATGAPDPRNFQYSYQGQDEEYNVTTVTGTATMPVRGVMKASSNSVLSGDWHGGWIITRLIPDGRTEIAENENFEVEVWGPAPAAVGTLQPSATGPVIMTIQCYAHNVEGYPEAVDQSSLWVTRAAPVFLTNLGNDLEAQEYVIYAGRVAVPTADTFKAYVWTGGATVDPDDWAHWAAAEWHSRVNVSQTSGGVWETTLDLSSGVTLTGVKAIRVDFLAEDNTSAAAITTCERHCINCRMDPAGSVGLLGSDGNYWYCAATAALLALGEEGEAALANFVAGECYQVGTCTLFAAGNPDSEMDEGVIAAAIYGLPWQLIQYMAGVPYQYGRRASYPGMLALAGSTRLNTPTGYHATIDNSYATGGFSQMIERSGALRHIAGGHWLDTNLDGNAPDAANSATWPPLGPLSSPIAGRKTEWGADAAADGVDGAKNIRMRPTHGGRDIAIYNQWASGHIFERLRWKLYELWWPRIAGGTAPYTHASQDGTIYQASYGQDFAPCDPVDEEYRSKVSWAGKTVRFNRSAAAAVSETVRGVTIASAVHDAGETRVNLQNPSIILSSYIAAQTEISTEFCSGGVHVAPEEFRRVLNWTATGQSFMGPGMTCIRRGMGIKFTDEALAGTPLYNRTFAIEQALPYAGPDQSFIPGANDERHVRPAPGAHFMQYGYGEGRGDLQSVTATRNTGLSELACSITTPERRLLNLAHDTCQAIEGQDAAGNWGVHLFFSRANATGEEAEREIELTITTDAHVYTLALDIETAVTWGWDVACELAITTQRGDSVASVQGVSGTILNSEGQLETIALTAMESEPVTWADWPSDGYYVVGIAADLATIKVSPEFALGLLVVTLRISAYAGNSSQYYDSEVAAHHGTSLFTGHKATASKQDQLVLIDEEGLLAANYASLDGKSATIVRWPGAAPGTMEGAVYDPDNPEADIELQAADYALLAGSAELYLANRLLAGKCLKLGLMLPDVTSIPAAQEIAGLRTILERILGGMGLS